MTNLLGYQNFTSVNISTGVNIMFF